MGFTAGRGRSIGAPGATLLALAVLCVALQFVGMLAIPAEHSLAWVRRLIFLSTTVTALGVAIYFRRILGAWLLAAGIALNLLPIIAHGGVMPIAWETVRDSGDFPQVTGDMVGTQLPGSKDILLLREDIRFELLSDRFALDAPLTKPHIYSLGDFVIFAGLVVGTLELAAWAVLGTLPGARVRVGA